jgi:hypothetical protein
VSSSLRSCCQTGSCRLTAMIACSRRCTHTAKRETKTRGSSQAGHGNLLTCTLLAVWRRSRRRQLATVLHAHGHCPECTHDSGLGAAGGVDCEGNVNAAPRISKARQMKQYAKHLPTKDLTLNPTLTHPSNALGPVSWPHRCLRLPRPPSLPLQEQVLAHSQPLGHTRVSINGQHSQLGKLCQLQQRDICQRAAPIQCQG